MIQTEQIGEVAKFRLARTLLGRGRYFTAAYMVDGLMLDSGCACTAGELAEALAGSRVHTVVNTHSHEDHWAGNAAIQSRFGARAYAHPLAVPRLSRPEAMRLRPYQMVMWGRPDPSTAFPLGDRVETDNYCFRVIHTPGHSDDHVCFHEPNNGWLFTGDAYVGGKDRALRRSANIWGIIDSLKKLAALKPSMLFTGSGNVRDDAETELALKIEYLEEMGAKALALREKGLSYGNIRSRLFGPEMPIAYITLGDFCGRNLVRSYVEDHGKD
ncbi:MAG: MBL fold metallo-hydrolase [Pseudomonadota bacterium]